MNWIIGILYLVFAPLVGGILAGLDRKISAKMQGRKGPSILQPFYDVFKLFSKEDLVVNPIQKLFVVFFLIFNVFTGFLFFAGSDLLMVVFSFTLSGVFLILSAYTVNSPYSAMGANREMLQVMCYEPAVLLMAVGMYLVRGSFFVKDIIAGPKSAILYLPGIFLAFLYILTIKLRKSPFDISTSHHAHQELVKGVTTEISGQSLGLVELAHWYETVLIWGLVALFFLYDSLWSILVCGIALIMVFLFEIFIDNIAARVKWQMMFRSAWIITAVLSFVNFVLLMFLI